MIFSWTLNVEFEYEGKPVKCKVDKMVIEGHRPKKFYRLGARTGNRDLIKHNGQWIVIYGSFLPNNLLDALGIAIERELEKRELRY